MKEINLVNSKQKAKVDDEDFETVNQYQWYLSEDGYAKTTMDGHEIEMRQFVMFLMTCRNN